MVSKTLSIGWLAAQLAQHYGPKKISAFSASECAIALTSLANSIVDNETWHCNGFKNEYIDEQFRRYARDNNVTAANELQARVWNDGSTLYEKRKLAQSKKLARILAKYELPARDFAILGLYGGVSFVADGRDFHIASK